MTGSGTNPAEVHTRAEFGTALRERLGGKSVRVLEKALQEQEAADHRVQTAGRLAHPVRTAAGKTGIFEVLNGTRSPKPELLRSLLGLVEASEEEHQLWLTAMQRLETGILPGLPRVGEVDPRLLAGHKAIEVAGARGELPEYVPRDTDSTPNGARAKIERGAARGGFVLLVGESSVGKTRCAYEAVTALLPGWWLLHPTAGLDELTALAEAPTARTVVWLDELQRYLNGRNGLTVDTVRALLTVPEPILLVGTLGPRLYETYSTSPQDPKDDPYQWEREVIDVADVAHIATAWSKAELNRAQEVAERDLHIRQAIDPTTAGRFSPSQILAAAPQLVERWEQPTDPYAGAVLAAAVDATRLGYQSPLPIELLREAAHGYCNDHDRAVAPANWFEDALAYATKPLRGAASVLEPAAGIGMGQLIGYTVADYLQQYAAPLRHRDPIPVSLWDAMVGSAKADDLERVADAAQHRLLYRIAERAYRRLGNPTAMVHLASLFATQGRADAGIELLSELVEQNDLDALRWLASHFADQELFDKEAVTRRRLVESGGTDEDRAQLARLLARLDRADEALPHWEKLAAVDYRRAAEKVADHYAAHGEVDRALELLTPAADTGDWNAQQMIEALLTKNDRLDELESLYRNWGTEDKIARLFLQQRRIRELWTVADDGNATARELVEDLLVDEGKPEEALAARRRWAESGDQYERWRLARLLERLGRIDEAIYTWQQIDYAEPGNDDVQATLASALSNQDRIFELRQRAVDNDSRACSALARWLHDHDQLDELWQRARDGDIAACEILTTSLSSHGQHRDAIPLWENLAAADGDRYAREKLAQLLIASDRHAEGLTILRELAETSRKAGRRALAKVLRELELEEELRDLAVKGNAYADDALSELLQAQGRCLDLQRRAVAGSRTAAYSLLVLAADQQIPAVAQIAITGLEPDGQPTKPDQQYEAKAAAFERLLDRARHARSPGIADRVAHATTLFRGREASEHDKRSAIVTLAGILEERRDLIRTKIGRKDEGALFSIANQFALRHQGRGQHGDYDPAFLDWIFWWYLATVELTDRLQDREAADPFGVGL